MKDLQRAKVFTTTAPRHTLGIKSSATKLMVATCAARGVGPRKPMTKAQISQNHLSSAWFFELLMSINFWCWCRFVYSVTSIDYCRKTPNLYGSGGEPDENCSMFGAYSDKISEHIWKISENTVAFPGNWWIHANVCEHLRTYVEPEEPSGFSRFAHWVGMTN